MGGTPRPIGVCSVSKDANGNAEDVYQMFHNGLGSESTLQRPSDQWKSVAKEYSDHSAFLQQAIRKSKLSWEGAGAEAAHQNFDKLTQWHTAASNHATRVQQSMQTQATDFDSTKAKLNPQKDVPAEASWYEPWNWGDHDDAVTENNNIKAANGEHFQAYGTSTTHNSSSVPTVDAAPTDKGSAEVTSPSSTSPVGHGGGGSSYSPGGGGYPGGSGGGAPSGPGGYSGGPVHASPAPGYAAPPGSGGGGQSGWGPGQGAPGTGAPATTSTSSYQPTAPYGGAPGGFVPGAGAGGVGSTGGGPGGFGGGALGGMPMGGGMSGFGGQDSMRAGSGFGARGMGGMGAGASEGGVGSGARSGAGMGGAASESAALRGGAGGKAGSGMGPMGGGRGAKGEDDQEHQIASYLVTEDNGSEIVGDLPLTAPPVIGE